MTARRFAPMLLIAAVSAGPAAVRPVVADFVAEPLQAGQPRAGQMRDHFAQSMALHAAVVDGDLAAVGRIARLLETYEGPSPAAAGSATHVAAIRQSAGLAAAAQNIVSAAFSTAVMLTACGDCHRSAGVMPAMPSAASPRVGGVVGHMLAHQRATDQMLQGLVVPSNSLWLEGTKAFITAPLRGGNLPGNPERERQMLATEQRLHRIASDAAQATDARSRAGFYAQMLAGCADCHKQQTNWGPKPG